MAKEAAAAKTAPMTLSRLLSRVEAAGKVRITSLLSREKNRLERFVVEAAGLYCDFSRTRCSQSDLTALLAFARDSGLERQRDAMLSGERINITEGRAVLHTALRRPANRPLVVDGKDVMPDVHHTLARIADFSERLRTGQWKGSSGQTITDVVNIGIGGSQLGPELACEALAAQAQGGPRIHFLASLDPDAWRLLSRELDPRRTLAIVASKSWKTLETALGALAVRDWFMEGGIGRADLAKHLVAVSTNVAAATEFGISAENVFPFWDWVGGRYSMWSAIGLPVMLAIGPEGFRQMLAGAHAMDEHFAQAPLDHNTPVLHALISWWQSLATGSRSEAILPYNHGLRRLPAYLQQLSMESNGKSVDRAGRPVTTVTAPVTWGEPGTESQHSFFQLLHQGTDVIPVEFVLPIPAPDRAHERDLALVSNCLAQAEALLRGRTRSQVEAALTQQGLDPAKIKARAPHMVYAGNRPSSIILMNRLDPASFGALIALYEHRTAVLGMLWNVNSFDQWGVEVGKEKASSIQPLIQNPDESVLAALDAPTRALYRRVRAGLRRRAG